MYRGGNIYPCLYIEIIYCMYRGGKIISQKKNIFFHWKVSNSDTVVYKLAMMRRNRKCFYRDKKYTYTCQSFTFF